MFILTAGIALKRQIFDQQTPAGGRKYTISVDHPFDGTNNSKISTTCEIRYHIERQSL